MLGHLYDREEKRWRDCYGSEGSNQGTNAIAVRLGLVPAEDREEVIERLTAEWNCRTVLSLELFRLLFEEGREETAYRWLSRPDYPGWGYMIAQGSKTMWEGFEDIESHSHAWNSYPARLMADYVLGIRPSAPGYSSVRIQPYFAPQLTYVKGRIKTIRGDVSVRWERHMETIRLHIALPVGMSGELAVPSILSSPLKLESGHFYVTIPETQAVRPC